ncbi:MAG: hypothetical protein HOH22_04195 [Rhodospirillaceae bacterium]|nr:hypothetical protein [Rhodospirillaceae bacterium]
MMRALFMSRKFNHTSIELTALRVWRQSVARAGMALITVLIISSCSSAPPVPEDHYYRLQAVHAGEQKAAKLFAGTIEIDRFVADGLTSERAIVYSKAGSPNEVKAHHYHFWIKPPTVMLRDELVSFLRQAKISKAVVTPAMRVRADYVVTGKIRHLERVTGENGRTRLEVELGVRNPSDGELLFLKTYKQDNATVDASVASGVEALNTALSIIYADFLSDVSKR